MVRSHARAPCRHQTSRFIPINRDLTKEVCGSFLRHMRTCVAVKQKLITKTRKKSGVLCNQTLYGCKKGLTRTLTDFYY